MGDGSAVRVAPPSPKTCNASPGDPTDSCPVTDSVAGNTSEMPTMTKLDSALSQSPRPDDNDAAGIESHENTEADDMEDGTATVTSRERDSANTLAAEDQTAKADNQGLPRDPELMIKQPVTRPISHNQLIAEAKGIYAGLVIVEGKCIEVDASYMPPNDGPPDVTRYLLMIPNAKLIKLQEGNVSPEGRVRTWFIKVQKDATEEDKKPSTVESAKDSPMTSEDSPATPKDSSATPDSPSASTDSLPTTPKDCPKTSEEDAAHPHVSEKTAPQASSPGDYLRGFQVALELRAKEHEWPEYEEIATLNAAEISEEDRNKVIDGKYFLDIGYELVDKLLHDFKTAKKKAEEEAAKAKAKAEEEVAQAKAEQEASQANGGNKDSDYDPEATPTCVDETADDPEAQSRLSNSTQEAAPKEKFPEEVEVAFEEEAFEEEAFEEETFEEIAPKEAEVASKKAAPETKAPQLAEVTLKEAAPEIASEDEESEEAFEEIAPEEAEVALEKVNREETSPKGADAYVDVALEEATVTQQPSDQNANLSAQEPQPSSENAGVAPEDSGRDTTDAAVETVALTEKEKSKSKQKPEAKLSVLVDMRPLDNPSLYRKVGKQYWVLNQGQWIPSLNGEQYAALVALHRTLLYEHQDFFLVLQHPSASPALRTLAKKYHMPARMWMHGVHSFLELLRHRLAESKESMDEFIILAYSIMSLLDETVLQFQSTWIECKGDIARYRMAIQSDDENDRERWRETSKEEYTRALIKAPTTGRLYHHLAILARPPKLEAAPEVSPDEVFDATVSQLFYYTKSLVVKTPFFPARYSVLTVIDPIVAQNKEAAEKPASVPQTDKDQFLTAVVHLILASLEPETLRAHGHKDNKKDHLLAVYTALGKIKIDGPAKISRIRPSAKLGLLLCQLLLGIPLADKRSSPMMAAFAPDLVEAEDRADSDAMANARDIHDATIELIRTMVPYLLEEADTRDLGVWGFIYMILVFMRSLKTRPALLEWLGPAFHAKVLAPFLNMLLREDETRGGRALESASQSELVTVCSLLNEGKRLGKYGLSTEDSLRKYLREQEEEREAERVKGTATLGEITTEEVAAEDTTTKDATATREETTAATDDNAVTTDNNTATTGDTANTVEEAIITMKVTEVTPEESTTTTEETTTSDAAHEMDGDTKTPDGDQMHANVLPEHYLLAGLFFAREAESYNKSPKGPTEDAVVVACPLTPEATPAAVHTAEEPAVEQAQEESLTDSETDSEAGDSVLTDPESENEAEDEIPSTNPEPESEAQEEQQTEREAEEARLSEEGRKTKEAKEEEERKEREAKEAEEAGLRRDPPLFPKGWFENSKCNFDEIQVCDYVQDAEMCYDRSDQILRLAAQLDGVFFDFKIDEEGRHWISVPRASSVPKPDPNKKMPEIIERDGGVKIVYVNPSSHAAKIEKPTEPICAYEMELSKTAGTVKATTAAEKPSSTHEAEPTSAIERWMAPGKEPGADKGVDEDDWTHVSDESHGDQIDTRSAISRFIFGC